MTSDSCSMRRTDKTTTSNLRLPVLEIKFKGEKLKFLQLKERFNRSLIVVLVFARTLTAATSSCKSSRRKELETKTKLIDSEISMPIRKEKMLIPISASRPWNMIFTNLKKEPTIFPSRLKQENLILGELLILMKPLMLIC